MRKRRPQLRAVIAVMVLWQSAAGLMLAEPAVAAVDIGAAVAIAGATHCHGHGIVDSTKASSPAAEKSAPANHTNAPDCCQGMNSCDCVCAQGTVAVPQTLTTMAVISVHPDQIDLSSPPLVRRTGLVFRPPI